MFEIQSACELACHYPDWSFTPIEVQLSLANVCVRGCQCVSQSLCIGDVTGHPLSPSCSFIFIYAARNHVENNNS